MIYSRRQIVRTALAVPLLCLLAACATTGGRAPAAPGSAPAPVTLDRPPSLVIEAVVTDRKGSPAQDLRVTDFDVAVDGKKRTGLALGRLFRGPGAEFLATSSGPGGPGEVLPIAEQDRVIVLVVDQASFSAGDERSAREVGQAIVGMLGLSDRLAVVTLPSSEGTKTIDFERVEAGKILTQLRPLWGRAMVTTYYPLPADDTAAQVAAQLAAQERAAAAAAAAAGGEARAEGEAASELPTQRALTPGAEAIPPGALKAHAASTLGGLAQVARSLGSVPGGKTILFLSSGIVAADLSGEFGAVVSEAAKAHVRIVSVQVPSTSALHEVGAPDLRALAQATGGRLVALGGKPQQAIERLAGELSFSYLLILAPMPGDGDPTPHTVTVTLRQPGGRALQAPRLVLAWRIAPDRLSAALTPRAQVEAARAAAPPPPGPATGPAPGPYAGAIAGLPGFALFKHDPSVDLVLARVSQYALDYGRELSSIVSEETYAQEVRGESNATASANAQRTLVSDYLAVRIPGMEGWLPFRDVYQVDGRPVRDREDRLVKLFLDAPSPEVAVARGNQVMRESARYNIGPVTRTLNVPTLPLWFLEPQSLRRFAFRKVDEATSDGRKLWVLEFSESVRPTFVKNGAGGDIAVLGRVWADPLTGRIYQTRISALTAVITVKYGQQPEIPALLVPQSMQESYVAGRIQITANATYAKYRRFRVVTSEEMREPKK
jgi:hypothetical protein